MSADENVNEQSNLIAQEGNGKMYTKVLYYSFVVMAILSIILAAFAMLAFDTLMEYITIPDIVHTIVGPFEVGTPILFAVILYVVLGSIFTAFRCLSRFRGPDSKMWQIIMMVVDGLCCLFCLGWAAYFTVAALVPAVYQGLCVWYSYQVYLDDEAFNYKAFDA